VIYDLEVDIDDDFGILIFYQLFQMYNKSLPYHQEKVDREDVIVSFLILQLVALMRSFLPNYPPLPHRSG
jgi:hypothetical protein